MPIKFNGRAKYSKERIAPCHPQQVNAVRWNIEGEELTTEEIIARCEGLDSKTVRSRLHTGVRKWKLLSSPAKTTLRALNLRRRKNAFDSLKLNAEALKNLGKTGHQIL